MTFLGLQIWQSIDLRTITVSCLDYTQELIKEYGITATRSAPGKQEHV